MTLSPRTLFTVTLFLTGAGWGLTQPLVKIAVRDGAHAFGIVFWQLVIGVITLGAIQIARGGRWRVPRGACRVWLMIAMVGTLIPNSTSYTAAVHLPAGVMSIAISAVPMFALPMALFLRIDRFTPGRAIGLCLGLAGVALIALPEGAIPGAGTGGWVALALVAPVFYAIEGNYVARWGTGPLDPLEVLLGASALGAVLLLPVALATDTFLVPSVPPGPPEWAILAISVLHALLYVAYVWLVGRAGAVFAGQVSYLVTGFGVVWSMLILGEAYSLWVWGALALMLAGLALVAPREPANQGDR